MSSLIPPVLYLGIKKLLFKKSSWYKNFDTWDAAKRHSSGYDSKKILEKVRISTMQVVNREAVFERDSCLFDDIQYSWPLLSGLLYAHSTLGKLNVLDFGGSLGSSYRQNMKFFQKLPQVTWSIVEQNNFYEIGKKEFETDSLRFFSDIDLCINQMQPQVLLLASCLQYIESPYSLLDKLINPKIKIIIVDRTTFSYSDLDEIKVQVVPPHIYDASYPCRLLSHSKLKKYFVQKGFEILEQFNCEDPANLAYKLQGMILIKI